MVCVAVQSHVRDPVAEAVFFCRQRLSSDAVVVQCCSVSRQKSRVPAGYSGIKKLTLLSLSLLSLSIFLYISREPPPLKAPHIRVSFSIACAQISQECTIMHTEQLSSQYLSIVHTFEGLKPMFMFVS